MAIVINGSGTVTGLAVGGLPDGTVDSDTIATGTIVNADINDLAASKLTGALPAISGASLTNLPDGGKMLQTPLFTQANTSITIATTTMTDIGLSVAITPSSTSSKIMVWWLVHTTLSPQDGFSARLLKDSTVVWTGKSNNIDIKNNMTSGYDSMYRWAYMYLDSPNTTSSVTYKVQVGAESGDTIEVSSYDGYSSLLVMEVGA